MEIYTVSFFGHREIDNAVQVERNLEEKITELIRIKQYVELYGESKRISPWRNGNERKNNP